MATIPKAISPHNLPASTERLTDTDETHMARIVAPEYLRASDGVVTNEGITWTSRTSAVDNVWYSICYGNGLFVAVSYSGTGNRVMTSPDGITWTGR